jgi:hypothetical protein
MVSTRPVLYHIGVEDVTYSLGVIECEPSCSLPCLDNIGFGDVEGLAGFAQLEWQILGCARRLGVAG